MPDPTITEVDSEYKFSDNLRIKVQSGTVIDVQPTQGGIIRRNYYLRNYFTI